MGTTKKSDISPRGSIETLKKGGRGTANTNLKEGGNTDNNS